MHQTICEWLVIISIVLLMLGCQNQQRPILPANYSGTLHGGMMAIGGETSGWMLMREGESSGLELDVSRVSDTARRLDGQRVIVSGSMTQRQYVERGPVKVLVVEQMIPASDDR